jgi:hypothetical protein
VRPLHWSRVADCKVEGTIWELEVDDESVALDVPAFEQAFALAARPDSPEGVARRSPERPPKGRAQGTIRLIPP